MFNKYGLAVSTLLILGLNVPAQAVGVKPMDGSVAIKTVTEMVVVPGIYADNIRTSVGLEETKVLGICPPRCW